MKKKNLYIIYILFISIIYFSIKNIYVDNDIWFILNHGRYVLNNGFPYIEPFTIHMGLSFVMQQWLVALIYWLFYNIFGAKGLFFIVVFIGTFITYVYYKLCLEINGDKFISFILSLVFLTFISNFIVARPQIFTYLILIVELYLVEKYIKENNQKYLYYLPLLSLLLINLHASMWFLQFAFLLPVIINGIKIKNYKLGNYKLKPILIVVLIMLAVGFLNPYGYKSILYVFNSYGIDYINEYVIEMKALTFKSLYLKKIIFIIFIIIFQLNFSKKRRVEIRYLFLLFGTFILALSNFKGLPYFYISCFILFADYLKNINCEKIKLFKKLKKIIKKFNKIQKSILFAFLLAVKLILIILTIYVFIFCLNNLSYENSFKDSFDYIEKNYKIEDVKLYVNYENGGYAEFRGVKSYIDPRAEIFLKNNNGREDILKEYFDLMREEDVSDSDFEVFINKYKFTHYLVDNGDRMDKYLSKFPEKYKVNYEEKDVVKSTNKEVLIGKVYVNVD